MKDRLPPILAWVACVLVLGFFFVHVVLRDAGNPNTSGFSACYVESRILVQRPADLAKIYDTAWFQERIDGSFENVREIARGQPPTMALMMWPLAWLSPAKARIVWIGSSVVFWMAGLGVLSGSLGLPRFTSVPPTIWLAAVTSRYPALADNLQRGQGYVLLFFLLTLFVAFALRSRGRRPWIAGIALGGMVALKSAGLWLYPLLLLARRWRIVAGASLTPAAIVLSLSPFVGFATWHAYLSDAPKWVFSDPSNYLTTYQTVRSLAGHLFFYDPTWNPAPMVRLPAIVPFVAWSPCLALLACSIRFQELDSSLVERRALTLAMFTAPLAPMAPIGEGHHYMLALPALVIAWWWAAQVRPGFPFWIALTFSTLLVCVPLRCYQAPLFQRGWLALAAYPRVYGALALWALLLHALRRGPWRGPDGALVARAPSPERQNRRIRPAWMAVR